MTDRERSSTDSRTPSEGTGQGAGYPPWKKPEAWNDRSPARGDGTDSRDDRSNRRPARSDPPRTGSRDENVEVPGLHNPVFQETKATIHRRLLERINLSNLNDRDQEDAVIEIRNIVRQLLMAEDTPLNQTEREQLVEQVIDEVFGLGPIEPLVHDPTISDILINTHSSVYIERNGRLEKTEIQFKDDRHLLQVIDRIVSGVGRRIDDASPMVDARLSDGSRVNAIIPPLAIDGPHVSIRKFRRDVLSEEDLLRNHTVTEPMMQFMKACVASRLNILVSGGTGSGKTTMLNVLSASIPPTERIVTIEDSAELQLRQHNAVRLETRPPNVEGRGEVSQRQLVINALRMRPDRIIVGEVRGPEAVDMLQAMNTGHDGSITTLHANSPRDALRRLETMISMASLGVGEKAMRQQIASALQIVIHLARLSDGGRRVLKVAEIIGMEGEVITMQDLFTFERRGVGEDGKVIGSFRATGIRPKCAEVLLTHGVDLDTMLFSNLDDELAARSRRS